MLLELSVHMFPLTRMKNYYQIRVRWCNNNFSLWVNGNFSGAKTAIGNDILLDMDVKTNVYKFQWFYK